ncbi:Sel1 domain-containing protein [Gonapodya prolifera JEL478]|uniref:Sel1 domain-containing protein n=1 Tax=Gonapodya prolifera (strain JEL478) TaxID=1344416 RepID=A0A139A0V3_GONPJ|nr:Sel1 domain-containing protein [Gonapodya prolifera JEL478]|eukprot:KXS10372.1 Sel1 domain-containing protein [Gonapodya prolifera JEL478]
MWYTRSAELGFSEAQNNLGCLSKVGMGVKQDYGKALEWYRKAEVQGGEAAMSNLGLCYDLGQGVERDLQKALEWYRKAVEHGRGTSVEELRRTEREDRGLPTEDLHDAASNEVASTR